MKKKAGSPRGAKISRNVRETIAADDETDLNLALESLVISQPQDRNGEKSSLLSRAHQFVVRVAEWDVICVTRIDIPKFRQLMPPRISERGRERERERERGRESPLSLRERRRARWKRREIRSYVAINI